MKRSIGAALLALACGPLAGCGSATTLTVRPTRAAPAEVLPTPQLSDRAYRRILLLAPDAGVQVDDSVETQAALARNTRFLMSQLERALLAQGFEVISPEVVARAGGGSNRLPIERAMIMGKETRADAVLAVQALSVNGAEKFFDRESLKEVEPSLRVRDDDRYVHRKTEVCLFRLPYYELRAETKLIDVQTGDVLWVGAARETSLDTLRESWVAKLDSDCDLKEQTPFLYRDYLGAEDTFRRTSAALFEGLVKPLKEPAFRAKPEPPPPPPPPPPPAPEPPKEVKEAVVSSRRASLRDHPASSGRRLFLVPRKAKVEVVETMGEWIKVKLQDGTEGWMHESTLIQTN